jgi:signal transduction histidine kinase
VAAVDRSLRAPIFGWAWPTTVHLIVGLPIGLTSACVVLILAALTGSLLVTVVLAPPVLVLLITSVRGLSAMQRSRFRSLLGVQITTPTRAVADGPAESQGSWLRRLLAEARSSATWRQIGYHLLALPIGAFGFVVIVTAWSVGLAMSAVFAYGWALPRHGIFGWDVRAPGTDVLITSVGIVVILSASWLAASIARMDAAVARALLGPRRRDELAMRVDALARSRAGAVDAADAERRRIERDLHDGAQQRLVSLAMNLGMARAALDDAAAPATRQAITQAHEEAKRALAELRDLVRGLHPAVLADRGLDAALSGLAARSPVPVRLRVDLPRRCSPTIEAVAYFIVAEVLTNAAKHAGATQVTVDVVSAGSRLRMVIVDNGRGGADPARGSGLRGLAQRTASVDGTLRVDSPAGGPTRIEVELPCAR